MFITLTPGGTGKREEVALQIQEVAPTDSRGGPHHVCGVALSSIQDPPDASTIVGYILVIPTPGMLCWTAV